MGRMRLTVGILVSLCMSMAVSAPRADQPAAPVALQKVSLNIRSQPLDESLTELGAKTGLTIIVAPELDRGITAPAIQGNFTVEEALKKLLAPSGLKAEFMDAKTVAVRQEPSHSGANSDGFEKVTDWTRIAQTTPEEQAQANSTSQTATDTTLLASAAEKSSRKIEEVVVTGTHIRGEQSDGSSLVTYSRDEISASGVATLDQFARKMPENFSSVDAISSQFTNPTSGFGQNGVNVFQGAGFNLHGLGPGATLTLLDGHRLAPGGGDAQFADISLIPVAAIERIEVLPDGSSAVYGSDAVAGVVNIVLRKGFSGAETTIRGSGTSQGGAGEKTASQVIGDSWGSGGAMLTYEHDTENGLRADQRDFIPSQGGLVFVVPQQETNSAFVSASQDLFSSTKLSADGFFTKRDFLQNNVFDVSLAEQTRGHVTDYGGALSAQQGISSSWLLNLTASSSKLKEDAETTFPSFTTPGAFETQKPARDSSVSEVDLHADGNLFSLPSGAAKLAAGLARRWDRFDSQISVVDAGQSVPAQSSESSPHRSVDSAYGELWIPIVSEKKGAPDTTSLSVSLAGRYDHYSDFGGSTSPKVGITWSPTPGLNFRGSYGRSFRAPPLTKLTFEPLYEEFNFPDRTSPRGVTTTLVNFSSGNPSLKPERSTSYSLGLDFDTHLVEHLTGSLSYFNIDFKDRISSPPFQSLFDLYNEPQIVPFITRNPSQATLMDIFSTGGVIDLSGRGEAGVQSIIDLQPENIAKSQESGVQLVLRYNEETSIGSFGAYGNLTYLLKNSYTPVLGAPSVTLLNNVYEPVKVKARVGVDYTARALVTSLSVNDTGAYYNSLLTPVQRVASWTTFDFSISYSLGRFTGMGFPDQTAISVGAQNFTDKNPPRVNVPVTAVSNIGFDPANASPVGREFFASISVKW